ncbi:phosphoglycerate dehydrogenase [Bacillus haikouensis]|jgi:D-3-phosphoglycerate dehydrogenase / 2-oxoglutarate reductase|uniref:phosphoglycerate dehydrogenase n=1 Tax=Bacillus haikouensis TaxID=1510468 RepID=UPI00155353CF|nr:phosphoglycerate dehydrogenase [Bacillus haikouensis]NQD66519.1 phosphoglycerate dehydrogenase [Bacillus haikouensis]
MLSINTYNAISKSGLSLIEDDINYHLNGEGDPDGLLVRSQNLHDFTFPPSLKAIARAGAGVNNIPVDSCTEKGIVVFNTPGANANAVKELVLANLIASSRNLYSAVGWAKTLHNQEDVSTVVESKKKEFVGSEIKGKKLGVVGLGAIGVLVANDALALGMDVVAYDPFISVDAAWRLSQDVKRAHNIEDVWAQCDFVTFHMPLTDQTKYFVNNESFQRMKKGITLLNFSRGELVEEHALGEALKAGTVRRYVTDFPNEYVLKLDNVVPVPHLGASTIESEENCAVMATQQLKRYLETGNIKHAVNLPNVELPYSGKMRVTVMHQNIPNMVGGITTTLSGYAVNIADMINRSKNTWAYTMIDLDQKLTEEEQNDVKTNLKAIEGVVSVRLI